MSTDRVNEAKSPRQRRYEAAAELAKSEGMGAWNDLTMADQGVYLGMVIDRENQN
jgi:hypothetical protein